ncbi:MAG TPA: sialidase family protein [Gemmatimonadaceae bacterium]|nr:sialidase family protein [Gemmatimonadaceae bacterium]
MTGRIGSMAVLAASIACAATASSHDPSPRTLRLTQRVEHIDLAAREPMVVQHPDGTLFVAGYFGETVPTLYRSSDRGASWERVSVGADAEGAGNSDVDLAIARDGTLYFISMVFDRKKDEGTQISIGASPDRGATWHWKTISKTAGDDRPWIDVAPDGTAHAIWNDGKGVSHVVSRDRGKTWSEPKRIHSDGGSSHLAIGPRGEIAARITPFSRSGNVFNPAVDLIAISEDQGLTWRKSPAPSHLKWVSFEESDKDPNSIDRWVEPLAWDATGNLYHLWTDTSGVHVGRSSDRGSTWRTWRIAVSGPRPHYPYLTARGNGDLAATWWTGTDSDLRAHAARITIRNDSPLVVMSEPFLVDAWKRQQPGDTTLHRDSAGEYFPVVLLDNGDLGVVTPVQNIPAKRTGFTWWKFKE